MLACTACGYVLGPGDPICLRCGQVAPSSPVAAATGAPTSEEAGWRRVIERLRAATAGEFVIQHQLGRGGMAAVFLAHDIALDRSVAIKVMSPGLLLADGMVERFREEAITIARLDHPNIVTIHAVRSIEDLHFFVMKFVEGRPLDFIIKRDGPLAVRAVLGILAQVGPALAYAHRAGIIHRDVKPANLIVDTTGRVVVTDFGIAKAVESPGLTRTGSMVGTVPYMSPEQCQSNDATWASDQYSLGVVIYELLTGRPPYVGAPLQVMQGHVSGNIPSVRVARPDCTVALDRGLARMLAKRPEDRWPDFAQALVGLGGSAASDDEQVRFELARRATPDSEITAILDAPSPRSPAPMARRKPGVSTHPPKTLDVQLRNAPSSLELGESAILEAVVTNSAGEKVDAAIEWSSSAPDIVELAGDPPSMTAVGLGSARVRATLTSAARSAEVSVEVQPARPATLETSLSELSLEVGEVAHADATAKDRRGVPLKAPIEWVSSDSAIVSVSASGAISARSVGLTELRARSGEAQRAIRVAVHPARVAFLAVNLTRKTLVAGETLQVDAVPCDARGGTLMDRVVVWTSRKPEIAAVTPTGRITAYVPGAVQIIADCEGQSSVFDLVVQPAPFVRIDVSGVPAIVDQGTIFRLSADAQNQRGERVPVAVSWRSSRSRVASVGADGVVEAHRKGNVRITAAAGGLEASVEFEVQPKPEPEVLPIGARPVERASWPRAILVSGALLGLAGGVVGVVRWAPWSAAATRSAPPTPPDQGTVTSGTSGGPASGPVAGTQDTGNAAPPAGDVEPGDTATAARLVLVLTPATAELVIGDSLMVTPLLKGGTANERAPGRSLRWQSSNVRVATVSETGIARAIGTGSARITAFGDPGRDSISIRVVAAQVEVYSVHVSPPIATLEVGSKLRLSAETRDAQNRRLSDRLVTWVSSNPDVAAVDERTGDVTARQAGVVTIAAISESARASIALTVTAAPVVTRGDSVPSPAVDAIVRFGKVAAGGSTSCATASAGLYCWGDGQTTPRAVSGGGFESVAIGRTHQCGLRDGNAFCWGANDRGQLGDGSNASQTTPSAVSGSVRFTALGAGESHTCGLDRDGAIYCWGANNAGQLGNGSSRDSHTPVPVRSNLKFISLTVGKAHTCAIASDGQALCWGDGFAGALGNNLKQNQNQPYPVRGDTRWQRLSAGDDFTCGLSVAGKALCWGDNRRGQLGDTRNSERLSPVDVARIPAFSDITTGRFHTCGLADGGRVFCWGSNERGQLGNGTTASVSLPTQIESTQRFTAVVAGNLHTCAMTDGNTVYCWGDNSAGQLGDGSGASHSTPVVVRAPRISG